MTDIIIKGYQIRIKLINQEEGNFDFEIFINEKVVPLIFSHGYMRLTPLSSFLEDYIKDFDVRNKVEDGVFQKCIEIIQSKS